MTDLPSTRQSLLLQLGRRDDAAWSEFLHVYEKAIIGFCIRRGLQEADALDAAQEVYAAIQARMGSWDPDKSKGSFRGWLFRVARNISVDLLAKRARQEKLAMAASEDWLAQLPDARTTSASALCEATSTLFQLEWQRALFEWAARQVQHEVRDVTWQAFHLTAVSGRKPEAVAAELGLSTGSVYTAKCRVVARIRVHVERWQECPMTPLPETPAADGTPT